MTRERIEDIREVVLPFVKHVLLKINYENLGESDAQEFTRDFNEVLDMAIKAIEQEPRKGKWTKISNTVPCMNCPICGSTFTLIQGGNKMHYCPNCGAKMSEE